MGGARRLKTVKTLDLSNEDSLCGDLSVHILEEIEDLESGDLLVLRTILPEEQVEESLKILTEAGIVKIREKKKVDNIIEVVLEKA